MKLAIVAVLLSSATAFADRQMVTTVGATFAATSYANSTQTTDFDGGARITLSFEDAPLPIAPPGLLLHEMRLVPELFAGFYMNDVRVRSQVGAGLRGEVWLSPPRRRRQRCLSHAHGGVPRRAREDQRARCEARR